MSKGKVVIIGGGCAGYAAAIYAGRAGLSPVLLEGLLRGGQLSTTTDVENYPGFVDVVQGPWLMDQMRAQAERCDTKILVDIATSIELNRDGSFAIHTDSSGPLMASAVIFATGADAKWLGLESEAKYRNHGVSACATCDGFFFRGKDVVVVGGGNVAVGESIFLANLAKSVTVVHRRNSFRAEQMLQNQLFKTDNIKVIWDHEVDEILGCESGVNGVRLRSKNSGITSDLAADGIFIAIGHSPNTSMVKGLVPLDDHGYIMTIPGSAKTSVPGFFAAGDVQDSVYRQAVTSAGSGCMAALDAEKYLSLLF